MTYRASLDEQYKRWAALEKAADKPTLTPDDVKGLSFSLGKPLTEEEFQKHRSTHKTNVVASFQK